MKKFLRVLIGLGILGVGVAFTALLIATKPEAKKENAARPAPVVEVLPVSFGDLTVTLPSQGLISARKRTVLASEVGGQVTEVSPKFDAGLDFEIGETILKIEDADYLAAEAQARVTLADAELTLKTELARQEQARKDWDSLNRKGEPSDLTLRKPHVASAEAAVEAARQALKKARRDVDRTEVKAPFAGRIARTETELGAYLAPGTPVAEIFTTDPWEVRLPLALGDWSLLQRDGENDAVGDIRFSVRINEEVTSFAGTIVRTEGEVERDSRSIYVVGEVSGEAAGSLLQPGLFVEAAIEGTELENVAVLPFRAFVDRDVVGVVDPESKEITRREVTVVRRSGEQVVVAAGLQEGEWVSITPLADLVDGMTVNPEVVEPPASAGVEPTLSTTKP